MYNDKNRQIGGYIRRDPFAGQLSGRSRPTFSQLEGGADPPAQEGGGRLCDGSLPGRNTAEDMNSCGEADRGWGLESHPLAMVFSPLQEFHELYSPEKALERGTMFSELDLPFEGYKGSKGGCC